MSMPALNFTILMMAKPKNIHLFLKLVENIFCTNEVGMVVI
jgi:hypothetical protein